MPWVRLDDQIFANPKMLEIGKDAKLIYLAALTYCGSQLTDGVIKTGALRMIAAMVDADRDTVHELVAVGLWETIPDGYRVHDYLIYNPSAEQVKIDRANNAKRQQGWRERSRGDAGQGVTTEVTNAPRNAVTNAPTNSAPYPSRTHPVPVPNPDPAQPLESESAPPPRPLSPAPRPAVAVHPLPSIESLIEQLAEWASKKGVTDILADEVERFHAHCLTKIDPATGYLPNSKKFLYINYVAGCQKWITNPAYDHTPRNRPMTIGGNVVNLVGKDRERFEVAQRVLAKRGYGPA